ncbi:MAG: trypsin-like peptidase domain-containing protein, partial [Thiobacillus sp.]
MRSFTHICQIILIMAIATGAQAKSATEVFESVSHSIVVVYAYDAMGKRQSLGSGVVLPDGDVVTNCHVIKQSNRFAIKYQEKEYPAKLKHADFDRDVCSLSVKDMKATQVHLGVSRTLKVGQRVYAIGAPQGLELTMSEGIVSSLREIEGGQYIQITAPISPGSSGGGLFDDSGRLIGLPTFFLTKGQQLNFAIPVEWVKDLSKREAASQKAGMPIVEWLNKAIELENKEEWPAMIYHAQDWTRNSPQESQAWYILGVAYGRAGQFAEAIKAYRQALRINRDYASAWRNLGAGYCLTNQYGMAAEAYQQALRINPQSADDWSNLGSPPRQNSCRPDMILNLGAIRKKDGTVRGSIQEQGGGAVV